MKDLVAQILSPQKPVKVNGKTYWVKQNIPWEILIEARLVYKKIVGQNRFFGMFRRESIRELLVYSGVPIDRVDEWEKDLKDLKVKLFKKYPDTFSQKPIRSHIKQINGEISKAHYNYILLDNCTLESFAEKRAGFFTLHRLYKGPTSYNFTERLHTELLKSSISISDIRGLARSDYWRAIWLTKKGGVFKHLPLTDEQISLASYSRMYENIFQHTESPPQPIIDDDDMLDGWLITQSKEKAKNVSYGGKIDSSKEVFIMAGNQDHANEIYGMNTGEQRAVQNVRGKQLKQGAVKFGDFADQQQQRRMQQAQVAK